MPKRVYAVASKPTHVGPAAITIVAGPYTVGLAFLLKPIKLLVFSKKKLTYMKYFKNQKHPDESGCFCHLSSPKTTSHCWLALSLTVLNLKVFDKPFNSTYVYYTSRSSSSSSSLRVLLTTLLWEGS